VYLEPTVLLTDQAAGDEDAPEGVVGIITRVAPDLVAHLSVRARNLGLLFAACFDDGEFAKLQALEGKIIAAESTPAGAVAFAEAELSGGAGKSAATAAAKAAVKFKEPVVAQEWIVEAKNFTRKILGGKSNNLNLLRGKTPEWMHLPAAIALPFGVYEKVLADRLNENLRKELKLAIARMENEPAKNLAAARDIVQNLYPPAEFKDEFETRLAASGLPALHWDLAWKAIKKVWASKWNERAYLSRRQIGMPNAALQMAVLIQQVVNAAYAFVIHTANPVTGDRGEVFAEVVLGLGETLVGNFPGRAFGFLVNKKSGAISELSYPSKSVGLFSPSDHAVIFRSDSNGEDLAGFAGAGLYDSFIAEPAAEKTLDYADEKLLTDRGFRADLCRKIGEIAVAVEDICGGAQDIEGALASNGDYYIVQNRPQVGL
jgi:alpha-glucan,water dikinase